MKAVKVVLAGLVLAGAVGLLCWRVVPLIQEKDAAKPPARKAATRKKALPIDQKIEAVGVVDLDRKPASTQDFLAAADGKPIVVAFWSIT